jgi:hypothetical protein
MHIVESIPASIFLQSRRKELNGKIIVFFKWPKNEGRVTEASIQ